MKQKKHNFIVSICALALGFVGFVTCLCFYILSYTEDTEHQVWELSTGKTFYGKKVVMSMDLGMGMIVSLVVLIFGIYLLYRVIKDLEITKNPYLVCATTITGLAFFYTFYAFFNPLLKHLVEGEEFSYVKQQAYLYLAVVFLALFIYLIILDVKAYKEHKTKLHQI